MTVRGGKFCDTYHVLMGVVSKMTQIMKAEANGIELLCQCGAEGDILRAFGLGECFPNKVEKFADGMKLVYENRKQISKGTANLNLLDHEIQKLEIQHRKLCEIDARYSPEYRAYNANWTRKLKGGQDEL